uniref:Uncharacterized protein n=1 Tax=Meloidogyne enterolobii TaxID=390850 RepID=A0A6V7WCK3_MELEN|nr:unnamed protein product [Meloidogyne enterolobii]CAD2190735.1 unnamed protein product [Meloidogyne enterolobii]
MKHFLTIYFKSILINCKKETKINDHLLLKSLFELNQGLKCKYGENCNKTFP